MISRLDRVILRDVLLLAVVCVLGLTFLFTALSLYQIVNRFEVTPRFGTLVSFAPSLWVSLLPMTMPMSALFAATLVFGRMRSERELLLLAASGVSPWRPFVMLLPVGVLTAAVAWFGVSIYGPEAYAERHSLQRLALADFIDHPPQGARELRFPGRGGSDPSIDISYGDVEQGRFTDLKILVYNDLGLLASLTARSASIGYQRHNGMMVLTRCYEPRLVQFNPESGAPAGTPMVAEKINELRVPFSFGSDDEPDAPKAKPTGALLDDIARDIEQRTGRHGAAAELVRRVSLSAAGLLLPLLGALLAALVNHPNRLFAIGAGVIPCALGYYPLMTAATTFSENGTLPPAAAAAVAPAAALVAIASIAAGMVRGRWA
ncbi:MAG: LptF/LptG family permease [Planctomycetota bacterium]|nr:LptF/LptG family permease [Planctomycetota bacterium]